MMRIRIEVERETDGTIRETEYALPDKLTRPNVVSESIKAGVLFQSLYNEVSDYPLPAKKPECKGFRWIGQPMESCDNCGLPIWEHDDLEMLDVGQPVGAPGWPRFIYKPMTKQYKDSWRNGHKPGVRTR